MVAVISTIPLILALWFVAWLCGVFGVRLPKNSWNRLLLAIAAICTCLGVPVLQVYLLTILGSDVFAHDIFIYVLIFEGVPAIAITFYALIREGRLRKTSTVFGVSSETTLHMSDGGSQDNSSIDR
jgi:hypothetical protein